MRVINLTNQTFGRLTVLERSGSTRGGKATWHCGCSCGNVTVRIDNLGGMEFENAAGGEKIFFHPEQVEQLERLLWERKGQGPKSANLPKRPKRKGRAK